MLELLRQAAQHEGLLDADDAPSTDGVISEAAANAIEALLEREIVLPLPATMPAGDTSRHTRPSTPSAKRSACATSTFAVTVGVDVVALRHRAEHAMLDVRCYKDTADDRFAQQARELSTARAVPAAAISAGCRTGTARPSSPAEIFGRNEVGVLPRLVHSRFGLHVVEVLERMPGIEPEF